MTVARWAMIENGTVINVCLWDGLLSTWQPPAGIEMQPAPDNIGIGWTYDGEWHEPVMPQQTE